MVKINGALVLDPSTMTATGPLFADAKEDIQPGMTIQGMIDGYELGFGSSVITAGGDVGFLKSDGTWNWL